MPTELDEYLDAYLVPDGAYYDADENFGTSEPGEIHKYSNVGAALAALALQSATGTSFEELCERGIFDPLGMTNTHWHRSQFAGSNPVATEYTRIDGEQMRIPDYSLATWPDGGLHASARDLARYIGAVMNGGTCALRVALQRGSHHRDLLLRRLPGVARSQSAVAHRRPRLWPYTHLIPFRNSRGFGETLFGSPDSEEFSSRRWRFASILLIDFKGLRLVGESSSHPAERKILGFRRLVSALRTRSRTERRDSPISQAAAGF